MQQTACTLDTTVQKYKQELDGKYSERVQIHVKAFCHKHLATLSTLTILRPASFEFTDGAICKQSRVYGIF